MENKRHIYVLLVIFFIVNSCKNFVQVEIPPNQISSENAFKEEGSAKAAVAGVYARLATGSLSANMQLAMEYYSGSLVFNGNNDSYSQFMFNAVQADNSFISSFWTALYQYIYFTNSAIESLENSHIEKAVRNQLLGEVLFIRAFCYYYLVNLWGDVPLVVSTDWQTNQSLGRTKQRYVYDQMIRDLDRAQGLLSKAATQERVTVNYYCASALLSRIYIQLHQWEKGKENALEVTNSSAYKLEKIEDVFIINSSEVVWQLMSINPSFKNTNIGQQLIPWSISSIPNITISESILKQFEDSDLRKEQWLASNTVNGMEYFYPYKYKEGIFSNQRKENLVVFRLAEQYLNSAQARLELGDTQGALDDLNLIRLRASLPIINPSTNERILSVIQNEMKKEFFGEWGLGWLGNQERPLWPIPLSQLEANPHLDQNTGY